MASVSSKIDAIMDIHSVLTLRESWPDPVSLDLALVRKEQRRVNLLAAALDGYRLRLNEQRQKLLETDPGRVEHQPLFLSVEAEDEAIYQYVVKSLHGLPSHDSNAKANCESITNVLCEPTTQINVESKKDIDPIGRDSILHRGVPILKMWIENYEKALRQREGELSNSQMASFRLLDLPTDVLRCIFDQFRHQSVQSNGAVDWSNHQHGDGRERERLQTIKSARLGCRVLNQVASPHLCPILRLRIDRSSLKVVQNLLEVPSIRSGVRGISVNLNYCPVEVTKDHRVFLRDVERETHRFYTYCIQMFQPGDARIEPTKQGWKSIARAIGICGRQGLTPAHPAANTEQNIFVEPLCRAFLEYKNKRSEQLSLLQNGAFADTLASCLAKLRRPIDVNLSNANNRLPYHIDLPGVPGTSRPPAIFTHPESLAECLSKPHGWPLHGLESAGFDSTRLICELPLAMQKNGVVVRGFSLPCLANMPSLEVLDPQLYNKTGWQHLQSLAQSLQTFEIPRGFRYIELPEATRENDGSTVELFLRAMLSGRRLSRVQLDFGFLTHCGCFAAPPEGRNGPGEPYQLKSNIFSSPWPGIKHVSLRHLDLCEAELRRFCEHLGDGLESFELFEIKIIDGVWIQALNILHDRIASRARQNLCQVTVGNLYGGEAAEIDRRARELEHEDRLPQSRSSSEMGRLVQEYLSGEGPLDFLPSVQEFETGE